MPPALVLRLPPIVALPSAASESGNSRSCARAAACTSSRTQPASAVSVLLAGSTARMRVMRLSDTRIARPVSSGVAPPTSPVLPPCGTTGVPVREHQRDDPCNFVRRRGQDHRLRAPYVAPAPVDQERRDRVGFGEYMGGTDDAVQLFDAAHDEWVRRLAAIFIGRR